MHNNQRAVLTTLIYSDLFNFPLTQDEIWQFLPPGGNFSREDLSDILVSLYPFVSEEKGYYFMRGKNRIVVRRQKGEKEANRKMAIGRKTAKLLGYIPSIQFIGLSGNVATGSASAGDDIDFFIITRKKTLFTTRLLVLLVLEFLGVRRRRTDIKEKDKICANFFLEETMISFPRDRHDLYTSREIAQLIPLFERNQTYKKFLIKNSWMKSFLPHTIRKKSSFSEKNVSVGGKIILNILSVSFIETILQRWQLRMIRRHRTTETISENFLAFHPKDYRHKTMANYSRALTFYESIIHKNHAKTNLDYIDKAASIFYTA